MDNLRRRLRKLSRRPIGWIAVVMVLGGAYAFYLLFKPQSPHEVARQALTALKNGDAEALCRLADAEELTRLNLTPANVSQVLRETLWRNGYPQSGYIEEEGQTPFDESLWRILWADSRSKKCPVIVTVIDDPKKGWKLNLSRLLYSTCWWERGNKEGMLLYYRLARKNGISGTRGQGGDYRTLKENEPMLVQMFDSL